MAESFVHPINLQNIYWQNEIIFVQHSSFLYDCVCLCACAENLHFPLFLWFKSAYQTQFELNFNWQVPMSQHVFWITWRIYCNSFNQNLTRSFLSPGNLTLVRGDCVIWTVYYQQNHGTFRFWGLTPLNNWN